jgi:hypothetical protein
LIRRDLEEELGLTQKRSTDGWGEARCTEEISWKKERHEHGILVSEKVA